MWSARKKTPQIHMGGNGVVIAWPMFSRRDYCVSTIDTNKSVSITKLMEQSGWNQICGMMFYSYMRFSEEPESTPRKNDSEEFQDAIEPPDEPRDSPRASRGIRCPRRERTQSRGCARRESRPRGRSRERQLRDGSSQTPEPPRHRDGRSQTDPRERETWSYAFERIERSSDNWSERLSSSS